MGAKRNFGAKISSYPILLFVDSDCEVSPELLRGHWNLYAGDNAIAGVLGKTVFTGAESFTWRTLDFTPFLSAFRFADTDRRVIWGPTNNLSCCRDIFQQLNGFDETFPKMPGGEDLDLGYRLYKIGYQFTTNPRAIVYHNRNTWNTARQMINRVFNWGRGEFHLYNNHQENLSYDAPKVSCMLLLAIVIGAAAAITQNHPVWLSLPGVFLVINLCRRLLLRSIYSPNSLVHPLKVLFAEILLLICEGGLAFECLRKFWFYPFFRRLIVGPDCVLLSPTKQLINGLIAFSQLLLSVLVVAVLIARLSE